MARGLPKGKTNNPAGRPKGTKNKLRGDLVQQILDIAESLAKEKKGLKDCARQDPSWFYTNFLKGLIPKNIEVKGDMGFHFGFSETFYEKLNEIYSNRRGS
jgi:hypothetical protein